MGEQVPLREVRVAAAFSGGVSLAVWMGGVATELQTFARACADPTSVYGALLRATASTPVVDVLAGTSAGGINGSALALALANGGDVSVLRDVWVDDGDLEQLIRDPSDANPPSILKGDEHLAKRLVVGLQRVIDNAPPGSTTGNEPTDGRRRDGAVLDAAQRLRLTVTTTLLAPNSRRYRDALGREVSAEVFLGLMRFGPSQLDADTDAPAVIRRLAVAARASASYPGGFEPASVPVGATFPNEWHGGVDLAGIADWPGSTWALDGGLLLNDPLEPVLRDVTDQPANTLVRRFVLQITPDAEVPEVVARGAAPSLTRVLAKTLTIPRERHLAAELDRVARHNSEVRAFQARRSAVARRGAIDVGEADAAWSALCLQLAAAILSDPDTPVAGSPVLAAPAAERPGIEALATAIDAHAGPDRWVPTVIRHAAFAALDGIREDIDRTLAPPASEPNNAAVDVDAAMGLRQQLGELLRVSSLLEANWQRAWIRGVRQAMEQGGQLSAARPIFTASSGELWLTADRFDQARVDAADVVRDRVADYLGGGGADEVLRRAILMASIGGPANSLPIELVQVTANAWTTVGQEGLAQHTASDASVVASAKAKLRGFEFMHFSAFAKRSWRANDWMWGRLDMSWHLCAMLLDLDRLRSVHGASWRARLIGALDGFDPPEDVVAEVEGADDVAQTLPLTLRWLAMIRQRQVLRAELPAVAEAIREDRRAGSQNDAADAFADLVPSEGPPWDPTDEQLREAVASYRVHHETLADELNQPLGLANATQLGAVAVAAVSSKRSELPAALRGAVASARGATFVLARIAKGLQRNRTVSLWIVGVATVLAVAAILVDRYTRYGTEQSLTPLVALPIAVGAYVAAKAWHKTVGAVVVALVAFAVSLVIVSDEVRGWVILGVAASATVVLLVAFVRVAGGAPAGRNATDAAGDASTSQTRGIVAWSLLLLASVAGLGWVLLSVVFGGPEVMVDGEAHRCPVFGGDATDAVAAACAPYVEYLRFGLVAVGLAVVAVVLAALTLRATRTRRSTAVAGTEPT